MAINVTKYEYDFGIWINPIQLDGTFRANKVSFCKRKYIRYGIIPPTPKYICLDSCDAATPEHSAGQQFDPKMSK